MDGQWLIRYQPSALCYQPSSHHPLAAAARAGEWAVRPDIIRPVTSPSGSAATGTADGIGRGRHSPHAVASRAGHPGAGMHTGTPAEGAANCRLTECPLSCPTTHLAGRQGGHDTEGVPTLAVAEGTGQFDPFPGFSLGLLFPANAGLRSWVNRGHDVTSNLASSRSNRSRSRRFSSSHWWAWEER